jgi:hypothetical protein
VVTRYSPLPLLFALAAPAAAAGELRSADQIYADLFARIDLDRDGRLRAEELSRVQDTAALRAMDADKSGDVDPAELRAWVELTHPRPRRTEQTRSASPTSAPSAEGAPVGAPDVGLAPPPAAQPLPAPQPLPPAPPPPQTPGSPRAAAPMDAPKPGQGSQGDTLMVFGGTALAPGGILRVTFGSNHTDTLNDQGTLADVHPGDGTYTGLLLSVPRDGSTLTLRTDDGRVWSGTSPIGTNAKRPRLVVALLDGGAIDWPAEPPPPPVGAAIGGLPIVVGAGLGVVALVGLGVLLLRKRNGRSR